MKTVLVAWAALALGGLLPSQDPPPEPEGDPGIEVSGVVVDPKDVPLAGVRIANHWTFEKGRRRGHEPLVSDAMGRFGGRDLPLPVVAIPLGPGDQDVTVDLAAVFKRAYESGPYEKIIDYESAADPPVPPPLREH